MMNKLFLLLCSITLIPLWAAETPAPSANGAPNIILIFIDDMGYADIGPFGNKIVRTPNLDKMANDGMRFSTYYATPVCSMSRACLMTGCYSARVSMPGVLFPKAKTGLNPDEITLAEIVKQKGYATAIVGKWHLGDYPEVLPLRQGFDSYFGLPYSNDMKAGRKDHPPLPLYRDDKVIETEPDQSQLTRRYTEEAQAFIRAKKDVPFFLYLPHTMVHLPLAASAEFKDKSKMGLLGDAIEEIDWSVGKIMTTLAELHLEQKTLVIFTSDNGPAHHDAPPFRGQKASNWEGGVREPCIMRWSGHIPPGTTCDRIIGNIDMLPTFAALIGGTVPADRVIDGKNFSSLLTDPNAAPTRDTHLYFTSTQKLQAIRQGPWKLFLQSEEKKKKSEKGDEAAGEQATGLALYNVVTDPGESANVAKDHGEIVNALRKEAAEREAEINKNKRPAGKL